MFQGVRERGSRRGPRNTRGSGWRHPTCFSPVFVSLVHWWVGCGGSIPERPSLPVAEPGQGMGTGHPCGQSSESGMLTGCATVMSPWPGHQAWGRGMGTGPAPTSYPSFQRQEGTSAWGSHSGTPAFTGSSGHVLDSPWDAGGEGGPSSCLPRAGFHCPPTSSKTKTTES